MTVATYTAPNNTTQSAAQYKANIDGGMSILAGIAQDFAPHAAAAPNMTVLVDAGGILTGGALVTNAQQTTATFTAPSGNPRIDRVVGDQLSGIIAVVAGTPAGSPSAPAIPAGKFPICQVLLQTTSTAITNSMITDERVGDYGGMSKAYADANYQPIASNGSFTITGTGFATNPTATAKYRILNGVVTLYIPITAIIGTSNATTFTLTGLPPAIQPASTHQLPIISVDNGSTITTGVIEFGASGSAILFAPNGSSSGWTASGAKSLNTTEFFYTLD
jgi:hypothetical protein